MISMRILVIEDEPKIAQAVKQGLELKGFAVDMVHDADNGLSYASDPTYDAIVLDRMLPGSMDGVALCQKLRADGINTPIIMLTARGTIGDRVEGLNSGADDYLVKPFSFDELTARVRSTKWAPSSKSATWRSIPIPIKLAAPTPTLNCRIKNTHYSNILCTIPARLLPKI